VWAFPRSEMGMGSDECGRRAIIRHASMPPGQTLGRTSAPLSAICPTRLVSQPSLRVKHRKRQQNIEKAGAGAGGAGEGAEESAGHREMSERADAASETDGRRFPVDTRHFHSIWGQRAWVKRVL
jgi:hypothetical protein